MEKYLLTEEKWQNQIGLDLFNKKSQLNIPYLSFSF